MPAVITVFYRSLTAVSQSAAPQQLTVERLSPTRGWFNGTLPVRRQSEGDFEWWAEVPTLKLRSGTLALQTAVSWLSWISL